MTFFSGFRSFIVVLMFIELTSGCGDEKDTSNQGGLVDITDSSGLNFFHDAGVSGNYFMPEDMGPGSAFFDYDNDGDQDIYLINGQSRDKGSRNRLFRQEADGSFKNVTEESGLGDRGFGMGVAIGDINNDNYPDVYITNYGLDQLYLNKKDGTFKNITKSALIQNGKWGCSAVFFDYDLNGYLDIYITNYVEPDSVSVCTDMSGRPDYCGPAAYPALSDVLYRNNGDETFSDVSGITSIGAVKKRGLGVVSRDFNKDGYPDLFVTNDNEENLLWINDGDGTFSEQALPVGLALNGYGKAEASMGIALGDISGNTQLDIFLTHLAGQSHTFYMSMGWLGFEDVSYRMGFERIEHLPYTGFGTGLVDLDLDGHLDLVIGNGRIIRRNQAVPDTDTFTAPYSEPNQVFSGTEESGFLDVSSQFSDFTSPREMTRGLAFSDYDNDGDIDILVNNCGGKARLFRNETERKGNWLLFSLFDSELRREPIGAKLWVITETRKFYNELSPDYSYLCSNDYRIHFGLGAIDHIEEVRVGWPGGKIEKFSGVEVNQHVTLTKGEGEKIQIKVQ